MANDFCNIPPSNDTQDIIRLLPPLPGLDKIVQIITKEANKVKTKYIKKAEDMVKSFAEGVCPPKAKIDRFVTIRNNIVESLTRVYDKVDRLSSTISGISRFLAAILIPIKVFQILITALNLVQLVAPIIPNPVLVKINAGIETGQDFLDKIRFKADGDQRLVPLVNGVIAANIATKLFANVLRDLVCKIDALDISMLECYPEVALPEGSSDLPLAEREQIKGELTSELQSQLIPIPSRLTDFIAESVRVQENSVTETAYRGFEFVIEEVPFSPTVNRRRALAQNSDGVTLLQTELSFTSTPDILIEELKLLIDRDNLKAE